MMQASKITNSKSIQALAIVVFTASMAVWASASIFLFDKPMWATFMHGFIFFTALTQGALAISMAVRLASGDWGAPFLRLGTAIAMGFMPFAIIGLVVVFLNHGSIHWWASHANEHLWFNPIFFVARNILFFGLFYGMAYRIYKAVRLKGEAVTNDVEHGITIKGFWLVVIYVIGMTSFSWDMSMTLNHGYADTIYGFYFIVATIHGGLALMVLLSYLSEKLFGIKSFPKSSFSNASQLQLALCVIWFYTWWSQFFPTWYAHIPEETGSLFIRASKYEFNFYWIYIGMIFLSGVIPFLALLMSRTRNTRSIQASVSMIILGGLWMQRYIETAPALNKYAQETVTVTHIFHPVNLIFALGIFAALIFGLFRVIDKSPDTIPKDDKDPDSTKDVIISDPRGW